MLIYSYKKEFLGIDEKTLKKLGFNSLIELQAEAEDFADLFIKTPGHIHNFQHVHWIDFISYADENEELKVMINVNEKTFKATLSVDRFALTQTPASPGYIVYLHNLSLLTQSESQNIAKDLHRKEPPKAKPIVQESVVEEKPLTPVQEEVPTESVVAAEEELYTIPQEPEVTIPQPEAVSIPEPIEETQEKLEIPQTQVQQEAPLELSLDDLSLDVFEEEPEKEQEPAAVSLEKPVVAEPEVTAPAPQKTAVVTQEWDNGYVYDPHVASKELGLPIDLIEEFLEDFIAQAREFKSQLYSAIDADDLENVKSLSHKLKGVAANLRIEDAYEVLVTVNTADDMGIIRENIDIFYKIIAKLAGESVTQEVVVTEPQEELVVENTPLEIEEEKSAVDDDAMISIALDDETPDNEDTMEIALADEPQIQEDETEISLAPTQESEESEKIELADVVEDEQLPDIELAVSTATSEVAEAAKKIGIDEASFYELFDDFVSESHLLFTEIKEAIANNDLEKCHAEAQTLQNMSESMYLTTLTDSFKELVATTTKDEATVALKKVEEIIKKLANRGA